MKSNVLFDRIGICTSVVCMIHCIAIPFLFLFGFESLLRWVDQEWIEWAIIGFAVLVGGVSFLGGFMRHRQHFIPVLFVAGFLLIINGESVEHTWVSLCLSLSGAMLIIYAHVQNLKWKVHVVTR